MKSSQRNRSLGPQSQSQSEVEPHARRLDLRHELRVRVEIVADGVTIEAETRDLCFGGLCLRTDVPQAVGEPLMLLLRLPETSIMFTARVAWSTGARVGLRFTDVTPRQLWVLSRVFPDG